MQSLGPETTTWPRGRDVAAVTVLILALAGMLAIAGIGRGPPAVAASGHGVCKVTGKHVAYRITPAIPGQLTVWGDALPPGWWNGTRLSAAEDGFQFCLATEIAYRAGLNKVAVIPNLWPQEFDRAGGKFDLAFGQASITQTQGKTAALSGPYLDSTIGVLAKKGAKVVRTNVRVLRIGVYQGSAADAFVHTIVKPVRAVRIYIIPPAMIAALFSGRIDAVMGDTAHLMDVAAESEGVLAVVGQYHTNVAYRAIYPKNSVNEAPLNEIIQSLKDDGTLTKLAAYYLDPPGEQDPTKIPFFTP